MDICPNCQKEIQEDTILCPFCNSLIIENNEDSETYICPVCGAENESGEKKCKYCCSIF